MCGLQIRSRSPRPPVPPPTPPPSSPLPGQSVPFFLCRGTGGTRQAPTWGAKATLHAAVNQSPERRGAAARALAGGRGEAEAARAAARRKSGGGGKERPRLKEREAAEGLVQARPLRGDQEAGAALDNQHAEMVRSFHPPFLFILDFGRKESRVGAPRGPPRGRVFLQSSGGRWRGALGRAGRKGEPQSTPVPLPNSPLNLARVAEESSRWEGGCAHGRGGLGKVAPLAAGGAR